jgi:hypothetical protein
MSSYILEIFQSMEMSLQIDRKDIDISAKRFKSNSNSLLTLDQFVGVLDDIVIRQLGFESFGGFIENNLFLYAQELH